MRNELDPIVDQWYQYRDKGGLIRVIAVEQPGGVIEVQDFDGAIEAMDFEIWRELALDLAEEPEDWTGPYDDIETDDLGYSSDTDMSPGDWRTPLDALQTSGELWQDTRPDEPGNARDEQPSIRK